MSAGFGSIHMQTRMPPSSLHDLLGFLAFVSGAARRERTRAAGAQRARPQRVLQAHGRARFRRPPRPPPLRAPSPLSSASPRQEKHSKKKKEEKTKKRGKRRRRNGRAGTGGRAYRERCAREQGTPRARRALPHPGPDGALKMQPHRKWRAGLGTWTVECGGMRVSGGSAAPGACGRRKTAGSCIECVRGRGPRAPARPASAERHKRTGRI